MNSTKQNRIRLLIEIFLVSTRLGLTSFGGPTAHLGYFYEEYVRRRKWVDEKSYADLVALCQFLPGPSSSQVGIGIGILRAGIIGGITSFIGFTFPSVVALIALALVMTGLDVGNAGWIHGLKIVAVAIVAHAIIGMAKSLTPDLKRKAIAILAMLVTLLWQTAFSQVGVILIAAFIGYLLLKQEDDGGVVKSYFPVSKQVGGICLLLFFSLLVALPLLKEATGLYWVAMFDSFYRTGSFVFGGGHVVLPLLENEFVPTGWINEEAFLAGYGVTQAVPGPLFTFAAYLGTVMNGWQGGVVATVAIFLPAFLLVIGALPFWDQLRNHPKITGAVMGVNAAVIGILIAALYSPIWMSSILEVKDFALVVILFSMLAYWKLPPWIVVVIGAFIGLVLL
ncbi:chromate transport protein ChrA [Solibacillus silvestris StLB046]|uniref:Chromate transport protein ChrA n=1 Tax=Solibacillus silvestris (strain StLB046) TaxID=1002809 RepID=F2F3V0_SOLSS|nr:chromate transporter [Solibacillus silvestris]BAK17748.1 chromate transport protein ChrA [Solibacillus silvestris StLB046]